MLMGKLETAIATDIWIKATWDEYLQAVDALDNEKAKGYYYNGEYRLEMPPVGFDHSTNHAIIMLAISLYAISKQIPFISLNRCSFRKAGVREVQPDASYYLNKNAEIIPAGTSIVDLDRYPAPDLVIEVSKTTLADDLGNKRLLYEDLGISEYWVVDASNAQIIAFKVEERGSQRLDISQVLPGLEISLLNEALRQTRDTNHSAIGQWLMEQFYPQTRDS